MSKLGSKEEILAAIQTHFEQIQSGSLTADGMESLVELTRELHERALILKYKAYEEKVFGVRTVTADPEPETTEETVSTEAAPEVVPEPEPEPVQHALGFEAIEAEILQAEPPIPAEEPVFDFDMFEKAEANIFTPEPMAEEPAAQEPAAETPVSEPEAEMPAPEIISTPSQEAQAIADEIEESPVTVSQQMPIAEENSEPVNIFTPYTETPAPTPTAEPTPEPQAEMPLPEELAIMNEPVIIPEKPPVQQEDSDMFKRFSSNSGSDDSLGSRLMSSKLTTLVGAFGLNEKLQCIRELFKGSSEAFNNAVETLDQQENFAAAKRVLAQYAQQNSWNLESNLTAEFIQKVERRYQ